ncbi:MAG: Protein-glutamine gamma-glutamyltransferase [Firmicutes bacterium ADurb.Bin419]|nr:MAG: Protein-glutamine gamma-glutamyltransferase [Firmicutes bacterium ADurb.Bin419]
MLAVPVSLVILLLTSVIPVSQRPIEWKWLDTKINYAFGYFTGNNAKSGGADYFSISSAGFGSSDNRLGGNIAPDDTLVLKVNSPKVIYLKGRSCDQYTGNSWVNTTISYTELDNPDNSIHFDTYELEHGRSFLLNEYQNQSDLYSDTPSSKPDKSTIVEKLLNMSIDNISVSYNDITTSSLFIPLKSYNFKFSKIDNSDVFSNPEGALLSRKTLSKGFNYSFDTYNINYGNKDFEKLMGISRRYIYDEYLEDSVTKVTSSIYKGLKSAVEYRNLQNDGYFWSDMYELELRKIMLDSPNTESMRTSLGNYLVNYFSSMLSMSDEEKLNFDNTLVKECLDYIEMQHIYEDSQNLFERILTLKQLADNSRSIYSKYLNIPQTVPDRVWDLAVSITKNEQGNFDKVKAIEQYLSKNYKYTYTPGTPPENTDFVDYFLFENKEGYCTYFASAMSILTRCIGIPSRYTEGYVLPSQPVKDDLYEVTNAQAHAWVEVYFEGIGWIQFEPTSSFSGNLYQQTESNPNIRTPQSSDYNTHLRTGSPANNGNKPNQQTNYTKIDYNKLIIILLSILSVILVIFLIVLANIIRRKKVLFNITKLPPREGVLELYNYYMKHFIYQKADFSGGETPMEHAKRLDSIGRLFPNKLQEIAKIFVDARYSQKEISPSDFNKVLSFYQPVLKATRENIGIVRYTILMYIFFKL